MNSNPKVTVIIPTRNRCETLIATIRTCTAQDYDNLEILISDNCSDDHTKAAVHSFADERVRYVRTPSRLSMTGNFEYSLGLVTEGYICFIGDDDGLMPGCAATVGRLARETEAKAVTGSSVYYAWPTFPVADLQNIALVRDLGTSVEWKNAKREIADLVAYRGRERNYVWGLPSLYRGFVHADVVSQARYEGRYFHSITPDAYSAFVNAFFIENYVYTKFPLTIEGVSGRSNGASQIYGKDSGEEASYLAENDIPFNKELIYTPNPAIVLAEAYLQARSKFPHFCSDHDFSFERVCNSAVRDSVPGPNKARVDASLAKIRAMHGITAKGQASLMSRVPSYVLRFLNLFRMMEIECAKFGANNVHQASILVGHLLTLRSRGGTTGGFGLLWRKFARAFKS